jgi:hypothetical protein
MTWRDARKDSSTSKVAKRLRDQRCHPEANAPLEVIPVGSTHRLAGVIPAGSCGSLLRLNWSFDFQPREAHATTESLFGTARAIGLDPGAINPPARWS